MAHVRCAHNGLDQLRGTTVCTSITRPPPNGFGSMRANVYSFEDRTQQRDRDRAGGVPNRTVKRQVDRRRSSEHASKPDDEGLTAAVDNWPIYLLLSLIFLLFLWGAAKRGENTGVRVTFVHGLKWRIGEMRRPTSVRRASGNRSTGGRTASRTTSRKPIEHTVTYLFRRRVRFFFH